MITIYNRQRKIPLETTWVESIVKRVLHALDYADFDVGILFTTNHTIRGYNRDYRRKDKPTDILSFSYHSALKPGERITVKEDEDKNLGDLIISLEYVLKEAHKQGISLEERLKILLVHGICHLLGYDHETDADFEVMSTQEAKLLKAIR